MSHAALPPIKGSGQTSEAAPKIGSQTSEAGSKLGSTLGHLPSLRKDIKPNTSIASSILEIKQMIYSLLKCVHSKIYTRL